MNIRTQRMTATTTSADHATPARRSPAGPADWIGQCSSAASAWREVMSSLM